MPRLGPLQRNLLAPAAVAVVTALLPAQQTISASGARHIESSDHANMVDVDDAVDRGLAWLAAQQNDNGFWSGVVGYRRREYYPPLPEGHSVAEQALRGTGHLGVTALCGMAFLSGGHTPDRGKYGVQVQKAVDAVLSCVQENGIITVAGSRMYSHAFATLFLAEVYGMAASARVKAGLSRATNIIVDSQNFNGAWRYNAFSQSSDLSVTVCQLQALRAARNIGIRIPKATIDRAVAYVKESQIHDGPRRGRYHYDVYGSWRLHKTDHYSIQAAAVTSLLSAGVYDEDLIEPVLDFLEGEAARITRYYPHHYYFWYGNYYASQVFFHADASLRTGCFSRYFEPIRDHLLEDQQADGRWLNPQTEGPGDAFATSVACILLQIPNQYLPIFQR